MKTDKISVRDFNPILFVLFICLLFSVSSCSSNSDSSKESEDKITQNEENSTSSENSDTNTEKNSYSVNSGTNQQPNSLRPVYSDTEKNNENTEKQNLYTALSIQDSSEFFKRFAPKTQRFKISNNDEQDIFCELGTYIHIDSGSFVFLDGSPVTAPVIFEVKEFYDKQTVLLSGLATNTKNGFLESGGMLHLEATSNGQKVKLQRKINIEMPTYNTETRSKNGMKVYLASNSATTNSNSANLNAVNNPPAIWETEGELVEIKGIPAKREFYSLRFLFKKNKIDEHQTTVNNCECSDVSLVSEKIEALSSEIDVEKSKEYVSNFRTIQSKKTNKKTKTAQFESLYGNWSDTLAYEDSKSYKAAFYPNPDKEERFLYDTIQLAIEIGKDGTGKVIEELRKTRHGISKTSIIRSINNTSGLRLSMTTSKIGICKGERIGFYAQSVDLWKDILEKGEEDFKTWKNSQRNGEESYTISYKKRKKPILVWTGIIKTTKKVFIEDYTMTRALRYYQKVPNVKKQTAYDAYRQNCIARYDEYMAKSKAANLSAGALDSYVFATHDLGWINCDRFYSVPQDKKVDLIVNSHTPVRVIFNKINAVMTGNLNGVNNRFSDIPKGEAITIFGIRKKGEKIFMAYEQTQVGREPIDLVYRETTFEEMKKKLASL